MKIITTIFLLVSLFCIQSTFAQGEPTGNISNNHIQQDFISQWEDDTNLDKITMKTGTGTAISAVEFKLEVEVFPNPVSDMLHIRYEGTDEVQIEFLNQVGRTFKSINSQGGETNMNIQDLDSGNYYIRVSDGQKSSIQKIMKIE